MVSKYQAVEIAARHIETKGFVWECGSSLSESQYFSRPGYSDKLRVAAHACRHGFGIAASLTFEYRTSIERDEDSLAWASSNTDIIREADRAIADYLTNAEPDEPEDA